MIFSPFFWWFLESDRILHSRNDVLQDGHVINTVARRRESLIDFGRAKVSWNFNFDY